jgi:hypothetical protein
LIRTSLSYCKNIKELFSDIEALNKTLIEGEYGYKITTVIENYHSIFTKFCPFKTGDRVCLSSTPVISREERCGWLGAKHFLVEGAAGTIHSCDYYKDRFRFGVQFDSDSWIHPISKETIKVPDEERGLYTIDENMLVAEFNFLKTFDSDY